MQNVSLLQRSFKDNFVLHNLTSNLMLDIFESLQTADVLSYCILILSQVSDDAEYVIDVVSVT